MKSIARFWFHWKRGDPFYMVRKYVSNFLMECACKTCLSEPVIKEEPKSSAKLPTPQEVSLHSWLWPVDFTFQPRQTRFLAWRVLRKSRDNFLICLGSFMFGWRNRPQWPTAQVTMSIIQSLDAFLMTNQKFIQVRRGLFINKRILVVIQLNVSWKIWLCNKLFQNINLHKSKFTSPLI